METLFAFWSMSLNSLVSRLGDTRRYWTCKWSSPASGRCVYVCGWYLPHQTYVCKVDCTHTFGQHSFFYVTCVCVCCLAELISDMRSRMHYVCAIYAYSSHTGVLSRLWTHCAAGEWHLAPCKYAIYNSKSTIIVHAIMSSVPSSGIHHFTSISCALGVRVHYKLVCKECLETNNNTQLKIKQKRDTARRTFI